MVVPVAVCVPGLPVRDLWQDLRELQGNMRRCQRLHYTYFLTIWAFAAKQIGGLASAAPVRVT
jgi:hypothetical protein